MRVNRGKMTRSKYGKEDRGWRRFLKAGKLFLFDRM
jgi:hypothetical protein